MRTPAQKYGMYKGKLKKLWHESPMYWEAYNRAKVRPGILKCEKCGREQDARLMEIDHVRVCQRADRDLRGTPWDPGIYSLRVNCPSKFLQALCGACHDPKTVKENKQRAKIKREAKCTSTKFK